MDTLSNKIESIFDKTKNLCLENIEARKIYDENSKSTHCATIFSGNKILSYGFNSNLRNKSFGLYNISEHAEAAAIRNLIGKKAKHYPRILSGKKYNSYNKKYEKNKLCLMVVRIDKKGEIKNSKCCIMCISQMKAFNIKYVYYTNDLNCLVKENLKYIENNYISTGLLKYPKNNDYLHIILIKKAKKTIDKDLELD